MFFFYNFGTLKNIDKIRIFLFLYFLIYIYIYINKKINKCIYKKKLFQNENRGGIFLVGLGGRQLARHWLILFGLAIIIPLHVENQIISILAALPQVD